MKSNLNKHLLTAEDILRYAEPETEDEKILFEALKTACSLVNELSSQHENLLYDTGKLEQENKDLSGELIDVKNDRDALETKLNKLKELVEA